MRNRPVIHIAILIALILLISSCGPWMRPERMRDRMRVKHGIDNGMLKTPGGVPGIAFSIAHAEELGLSDEQVKELKPIYYELKSKLIMLEADESLKQIELKKLMDKEEHDLIAIEKTLREIYDIKVNADILALQTHPHLKRILTKEQFISLKDMMRDRMNIMRDHIAGEKAEISKKQISKDFEHES